MRLGGPASGSARKLLTDMAPVQADRLRLAPFIRALDGGRFEPFPDGRAATGPAAQRGAVAAASGVDGVQLADGPLSGFDGRLPDYLSEALYKSLHAEDEAYRDFLAIFDRRLAALRLAAERSAILVASQDRRRDLGPSILTRAARAAGKTRGDTRHVQVLMPLLSRTRSLEALQRLLIWWCGRRVRVTAHFDIRSPVDPAHRTGLSARPAAANALGRGALLGRFGRTNAGRLTIDLDCDSRDDLDRLIADTRLLEELRDLIAAFLRERTPVTVFASIVRAELDPPRLSARRARASRLGAYGVLTPARHPDRNARIKLTEISQRG